MIPDALERRALDDGRYDACERVQYHIAHYDVHRLPEFLGREDAQVEETDGGLRQGDCEFVQDLGCPECLSTHVRRVRQVEGFAFRSVLIYLQGDANILSWKAGRHLANTVSDAYAFLSLMDVTGE